MLYITSPWLTYFIAGSLYLSTPFTHFTLPLRPIPAKPLATTNLFSVSMSWYLAFLFLFSYISNIGEIIWYLSFSVWFSIKPSRSIHVVTRFQFFFLWLNNIPSNRYTDINISTCIYIYIYTHLMPHFLCPLIHWWTFRSFPYLGYCK